MATTTNILGRIAKRLRHLRFVAVLLFPLAVLWLHHMGAESKTIALVGAIALVPHAIRCFRPSRVWELMIMMAAISVVLLFDPVHLPRLYPFVISLTALLFFYRESNGSDQFSQRIARAVGLSELQREALQRTTVAWTWLCVFNSTVFGMFLFIGSTEAWAVYAGAVSYGVILLAIGMTIFYVHLLAPRSLRSSK